MSVSASAVAISKRLEQDSDVVAPVTTNVAGAVVSGLPTTMTIRYIRTANSVKVVIPDTEFTVATVAPGATFSRIILVGGMPLVFRPAKALGYKIDYWLHAAGAPPFALNAVANPMQLTFDVDGIIYFTQNIVAWTDTVSYRIQSLIVEIPQAQLQINM